MNLLATLLFLRRSFALLAKNSAHCSLYTAGELRRRRRRHHATTKPIAPRIHGAEQIPLQPPPQIPKNLTFLLPAISSPLQPPAMSAPAPAVDVDVEKAPGAGAAAAPAGGGGAADAPGAGAVGALVARWRRQDVLDRSGSALRAAAWAFSLLAFLVMAANEHGDWKQFDHYEEYRYVVAIALLAFIYTTLQLVRHAVRLTGSQDLQGKVALLVDFAGDQVTAYLMMSALSAAIPITNRMREGADNVFTDSSAASISMAFFAFVCLALSAVISGFRLAKQTYI